MPEPTLRTVLSSIKALTYAVTTISVNGRNSRLIHKTRIPLKVAPTLVVSEEATGRQE